MSLFENLKNILKKPLKFCDYAPIIGNESETQGCVEADSKGAIIPHFVFLMSIGDFFIVINEKPPLYEILIPNQSSTPDGMRAPERVYENKLPEPRSKDTPGKMKGSEHHAYQQ